MGLYSMTGFAGASGERDGVSWQWELKSVNARGLDVRIRMPSGLDRLEPGLRERTAKRLKRGSFTANLQMSRAESGVAYRVNRRTLESVLEAAESVSGVTGGGMPSIDALLSVRGVLETDEPARSDVDEALVAALLDTFDKALDGLVEARAAEGERLRVVLSGQIDQIEAIAARIQASPTRTPQAIAARLEEQVASLLENAGSLDAERLHQEAALLAVKADIQEESDRLSAHVQSARELIAEGGVTGRRLDFLSQEFNREANTICSKSNDIDVTQAGLEMKAVIDQMREQVQNIE